MTYTIEEIKGMLEKITQGKWEVEHGHKGFGLYISKSKGRGGRICSMWDERSNKENNAQFIAAAPTIIRQLLDEVEKLKRVAEAGKELGQPIPMGCFSMMFPKDKVEKLQEALKQLESLIKEEK